MQGKLSVYQVRNDVKKHYSDFNKWSEICHIYTLHNLLPTHFDKTNNRKYTFSFYIKSVAFAVKVHSTNYLEARLKFWTAIRAKKQIKHLRFFHDRLILKVEVSEHSGVSPIGLSNVSILQQKKAVNEH